MSSVAPCSRATARSGGAVTASYALLVLEMVCCLVPPLGLSGNPFIALLVLDSELRGGGGSPWILPATVGPTSSATVHRSSDASG